MKREVQLRWTPRAFKRQIIGCQSNQMLLHRYQHSKISPIHKSILKIQILGSQELESHGHL